MGWHGADSVFNHMWVLNVELKSINNSLVRPLGSQMFTDHVLCTSDCIISASVVPANWLGQTVGRLCPQLAHHNSFRTFHHHGSQSSRSEIIIVCQIHQMPNIPQFQLLNREDLLLFSVIANWIFSDKRASRLHYLVLDEHFLHSIYRVTDGKRNYNYYVSF